MPRTGAGRLNSPILVNLSTMRTADRPDKAHRRPDCLDDATVEALGKLSEALETVERVRGHLYA